MTVDDRRDSFVTSLPPHPSSVRRARMLVRQGLAAAGRDELSDAAELAVSEVVTNALVHAGTSIDVAVRVVSGGVRVEVRDGSRHAPAPRRYAPTAGTGRGLMLLEEMVDTWGVVAQERGKTVWFQLDSHGEQPGDVVPAQAGGTAPEPPGAEAVQLFAFPLLLHHAWHQHAESLLREYLLASLDPEGGPGAAAEGPDPIQVHADASEALAVLSEHVPRPDVGDDPGSVMSTAMEPDVSCPLVSLPVQRGAAAHFETLDRALDQALLMADDGLLLTAPTQPEVRMLRRWICAQVRTQLAGGEAEPFSAADQAPPEARHPLVFDTAAVDGSAEAVVAADDANRIVAVSDPALEILGYDDRSELVGLRIVAIIPDRYRQAHLAGFTLHFLTGRAPLLGATVAVPVRRRDGSERPVELTLTSHRAPHGRTVFLGDLRPAQ